MNQTELHARADAAIAKAVDEYRIAIEGLTKSQTCEAFKQSIACGDFQRLIESELGSQMVVYIPFANEQKLQVKIKQMREALKGALVIAQCYADATCNYAFLDNNDHVLRIKDALGHENHDPD